MTRGQDTDWSELLSAYLDGELDEAQRARVVDYLHREPGAARLFEELRETQDLLRSLPVDRAPQGFADDVMAAAERSALLGTAGLGSRAPRRRRWPPLAAAASVALLLGTAGYFLIDGDAYRFSEHVVVHRDRAPSPDRRLRPAEKEEAVVSTGGELASAARQAGSRSSEPSDVLREPKPASLLSDDAAGRLDASATISPPAAPVASAMPAGAAGAATETGAAGTADAPAAPVMMLTLTFADPDQMGSFLASAPPVLQREAGWSECVPMEDMLAVPRPYEVQASAETLATLLDRYHDIVGVQPPAPGVSLSCDDQQAQGMSNAQDIARRLGEHIQQSRLEGRDLPRSALVEVFQSQAGEGTCSAGQLAGAENLRADVPRQEADAVAVADVQFKDAETNLEIADHVAMVTVDSNEKEERPATLTSSGVGDEVHAKPSSAVLRLGSVQKQAGAYDSDVRYDFADPRPVMRLMVYLQIAAPPEPQPASPAPVDAEEPQPIQKAKAPPPNSGGGEQ